jgi:hypothetical protein
MAPERIQDGLSLLPSIDEAFSLTYPHTPINPDTILARSNICRRTVPTIFCGIQGILGSSLRFTLRQYKIKSIYAARKRIRKDRRLQLPSSSLWGEIFRQTYQRPRGASKNFTICIPTDLTGEWRIGDDCYFFALRGELGTSKWILTLIPEVSELDPDTTQWIAQIK